MKDTSLRRIFHSSYIHLLAIHFLSFCDPSFLRYQLWSVSSIFLGVSAVCYLADRPTADRTEFRKITTFKGKNTLFDEHTEAYYKLSNNGTGTMHATVIFFNLKNTIQHANSPTNDRDQEETKYLDQTQEKEE